jgi:hypothetical protein
VRSLDQFLGSQGCIAHHAGTEEYRYQQVWEVCLGAVAKFRKEHEQAWDEFRNQVQCEDVSELWVRPDKVVDGFPVDLSKFHVE